MRAVPKTPTGARNAALLVVLWRAGLRIAEALDLEHRDIDLAHRMLTIRQGKGAKRRVVGIDPRAMVHVERWLEVRGKELGLPRQGKVFCSVQLPMRGQPMRSSVAREMLKALARAAGVEKRVHPHGFRHTHAFELMQEGVPLPIIQKQLGHNDLATTARYIDHLNPRQVIEAMQARQWAFTLSAGAPVRMRLRSPSYASCRSAASPCCGRASRATRGSPRSLAACLRGRDRRDGKLELHGC